MSGAAGATLVPNPLAVARLRNIVSVSARGDVAARKFLEPMLSRVSGRDVSSCWVTVDAGVFDGSYLAATGGCDVGEVSADDVWAVSALVIGLMWTGCEAGLWAVLWPGWLSSESGGNNVATAVLSVDSDSVASLTAPGVVGIVG